MSCITSRAIERISRHLPSATVRACDRGIQHGPTAARTLYQLASEVCLPISRAVEQIRALHVALELHFGEPDSILEHPPQSQRNELELLVPHLELGVTCLSRA